MYNGNGIFNILNRRINESQFIQYLLRRGIFKSGVNWSGFKNCKIIYYQQENHRSAGNYLYNKTNKTVLLSIHYETFLLYKSLVSTKINIK